MKTRRYFTSMTVALVATVLATLFLVACQQSQQQASPAPAAVSQVPSTEKVFVVFEGPWAFAPDPKNAGSVVAIAPKTKGHRDLYVKASNQSTLASGAYDLSFPAHSGPAAATADPSIAQAKIDPQSLQRALDSTSRRYVIRLPKPEEYVVSARSRSRLGATYPPDASTEKDYATAVSLRYNVSTLKGFSLAGTLDSGAFNPLLLQVETPMIHFVIRPAQDDDPKDKCDTHSRESFHDLTMLLGLTLYVDFPDNPADCHSRDPQNAHPAKAEAGSPLKRLVVLLAGNLVDVQGASAAGGAPSIADELASAMYFFGMPAADCNSPHIILTPTP
ncbi:MAG TPA: hypothetical protein VE957_14315 [Terriglobales bacterium]|nr:hypothetical protein [Terriglobales bacterium]